MTTVKSTPPSADGNSLGVRVGPVLQGVLVDLLEMRNQAKQFHWTVKGPFFRPVHLHLDEIAAGFTVWADDVAERLAALDVPPDGRSATVASTARVEPWQEGISRDGDGVAAFASRLDTLAQELRGAMKTLEPVDTVSHDMVLGITRGVEKQSWMVRSQAR